MVGSNENRDVAVIDASEVNPGEQRRRTIQALRKEVTLFKYLSPVECQVIYTLTTKVHFEDGEVILEEGTPGTGLHILERGRVALWKRRKGGERELLGHKEPYSHFGEMSILNQQPVYCSVVACGPVDLLVMTQMQFTNLLHRSESLGIRLLRALCEELSNRLREAREGTDAG